jgi:hypothetical protein
MGCYPLTEKLKALEYLESPSYMLFYLELRSESFKEKQEYMPMDIYIVVGDRWQQWLMATSYITFLCTIVWRVLFTK